MCLAEEKSEGPGAKLKQNPLAVKVAKFMLCEGV